MLNAITRAAKTRTYAEGELIVDGFDEHADGLYVVRHGRVGLWNLKQSQDTEAHELLGPGGVFGFYSMLTGRPVGPRAVALADSDLVIVPTSAVTKAFSATSGGREFAEQVTLSQDNTPRTGDAYELVEDLIVSRPVIVAPDTTARDTARRMSENRARYAAVRMADGTWGIVTDALLCEHVLAAGAPPDTAVEHLMRYPAPAARAGESATSALITMLDQELEFLLVLSPDHQVLGAVAPADFAPSDSSREVTLRQQIARAGDEQELITLGRRMTTTVSDLVQDGITIGRTTGIHSATVDAVVRRALVLTFEQRHGLDPEAFTWLSLGSVARGEAVLSSDVDSAVAFHRDLSDESRAQYLEAFADMNRLLQEAGLTIDPHGATAARTAFARSSAQWRKDARAWLADPVAHQGAIMTSLMVDARPIHGDAGLPDVTQVFGELRSHPGTMRLLLTESLSRKARLRSTRDVLAGRGGTFDIKNHALVPVVNIARWAALVVGSPALSTVTRLRDASGGIMLPEDDAVTLIEAFEVLQRLRLRYQVRQVQRGGRPTDVVTMSRLSPIDRATISQAVREISSNQKRMATIAQQLPPGEWTKPRT